MEKETKKGSVTMNRKIIQAFTAAFSVLLIALCLSVSVTAAKGTVGTVSKLKATATSTTATLKWSKAKNAKGYQISVKSGKKWKTVATVTSTTCKIDSLKTGKKYTYRVKAYGKNGKKKVWAKKTKDISVLTSPKKVSGLKGSVSGKTATLKWKKTSGATGYKVYQYSSSKKKYVEIKSTASLKTTVKKLEAGKTYKFAVKAYYKNGKKTSLSASYAKVSVTVNPDNISGLKVKSKTADTVTLNWKKAKGATAYAVYKYNTKNGKWSTLISSTKNTTVTIGKLSADTSYIFGVRALTKPGKKTYYSSKYMQISATTNKKAVTTTKPTTPSTPPTTTTPVPLKVPNGKAEIAAAYNKAINDYKAYRGKVNMKIDKVIPVSVTACSAPPAMSIINSHINNLIKTVPEEYTFENGVDVNDPGRNLNRKIIPSDRPATVQASGLTSATATLNSEGGYTIQLVFIKERALFNGTEKTAIPTHNSSALNPVPLDELNVSPINLHSAEINYPCSYLKATVDRYGRLVKLEQKLPFSIHYTGNIMSDLDFTLDLEGTVDATFSMIYSGSSGSNSPVPTLSTTSPIPPATTGPNVTFPTTNNNYATTQTTHPVSLIVNSYGYGDGVIYVEVDPSNWDGNFITASQNITFSINGASYPPLATCFVPSKKTGSIYEIKISIPEQYIKAGDTVSFTIPTGIVKNETGSQYNLSYSASVTV